MLALIAVVYLLVSGGWWVVLGWTLLVVTTLVALLRLGKHAPGAQHIGGADAQQPHPRSEQRHYSERRS